MVENNIDLQFYLAPLSTQSPPIVIDPCAHAHGQERFCFNGILAYFTLCVEDADEDSSTPDQAHWQQFADAVMAFPTSDEDSSTPDRKTYHIGKNAQF